ncbi:phosphatidylinositol kinase [Mesorhizobium hungaricum]|jgi:serine/threonine-protein kinase HipA|uniref:Phosphatidylinositol kinase n=1 Tax=Mesorhizobium hungaricum TaxID=1566387 RepID=A0A1C2E315_9HYPH|nr:MULTISPECIES: type II toxin-antitoxin system HipA family toxin [Mesorhizobium]MBN9235731.1 type II toxin-antitoxin system HipA family toxin [Mesorhizobium sp.]MDQ0332930.1 serine/threonine-protein kinase HipA [Mesorhizobium sp. YL-MeA3-2017]OCX21402.1 phosphatidylinositol kinase [Mesorhizobium hungaricum]
MRRAIAVRLGESGAPLGTLRYDQQGVRESAAFEYDADWLAAANRFSIEPGLPLVAGPQFHRKTRDGSVFHNAIADTEPDGWARRVILRDHAKRRQEARRAGNESQVRPLNAMDYLLAVDDVSRVGALRLQDEEGNYQRAVEEGRRSTPPLVEIAQLLAATHAIETNTETAADLAYLRGRGTSLGGLRPKCSVVDDYGRLAIGKFPSVNDDRSVTKGEVLAMTLARKAGVDAAEARLVNSDGVPVALIRRFDRTRDGGRLMYVSAATMLGADPGDASEHSYTELVDVLRQHGSQPTIDIEELWRRIAFSILITNVDDHLHNHGFLHVDRGQWRLAPAFDINPFPERMRELKTWVSEETGPEATIDALMSVIAYFRIKKDRAKQILAQVEGAVSTWRDEGQALGMTSQELDSFADAFEHTERKDAQRVLQ